MKPSFFEDLIIRMLNFDDVKDKIAYILSMHE